MPNTYSYTNTYTFTQTDVVVSQFKIAISYADVIDKAKTELLLKAISNQKISSIGIYAYNDEHKRVAEVEIEIDWEKHQQIISTHGDIFDEGQAGFNYKKGEAGETKVFVNNLVKSAKKSGLSLSMWVRLVKTITGEERTALLKKIGFNGGTPDPWAGKITEETSRNYKTIPQMKIGYKASDQI